MPPQATYTARHLAERLCRTCPNPAAPGHTSCADHLAKSRARYERLMLERDAANLCRSCGLAPRSEGRWCEDCREAERTIRAV